MLISFYLADTRSQKQDQRQHMSKGAPYREIFLHFLLRSFQGWMFLLGIPPVLGIIIIVSLQRRHIIIDNTGKKILPLKPKSCCFAEMLQFFISHKKNHPRRVALFCGAYRFCGCEDKPRGSLRYCFSPLQLCRF